MAAPVTGKVAKVEYGGGFVTHLEAWSISYDNDMYETTQFTTGTVQSREYIPGLANWTADVSGNFDSTSTGLTNIRNAALNQSTGTITLYIDKTGGEAYTGTTYVSNLSVSAPIDGKVATSHSFQGSGTLSFTTTT